MKFNECVDINHQEGEEENTTSRFIGGFSNISTFTKYFSTISLRGQPILSL